MQTNAETVLQKDSRHFLNISPKIRVFTRWIFQFLQKCKSQAWLDRPKWNELTYGVESEGEESSRRRTADLDAEFCRAINDIHSIVPSDPTIKQGNDESIFSRRTNALRQNSLAASVCCRASLPGGRSLEFGQAPCQEPRWNDEWGATNFRQKSPNSGGEDDQRGWGRGRISTKEFRHMSVVTAAVSIKRWSPKPIKVASRESDNGNTKANGRRYCRNRGNTERTVWTQLR